MTEERILIIDDDSTNLKLIKALLIKQGYDCLCKKNGQDALMIINKYKPDLMLVDVMMPLINGFELTRQVKANELTKHIPIILITALSDRNSRIEGLEAGAEEFVNKPIDQMELSIRVKNLLRLKEYSDLLSEHKVTLEEEVKNRTEELYDTRLEVIRSLGRVAEFRDNETGMHIIRMSKYSKLIALEAGLGDQISDLILNASPMHDIGKVGIPDEILLKPGKLSPMEWSIMKTHTIIGGRVLSAKSECELIQMAKSIALNHHEKWDGSGYPNGLKEEEIPFEARIVAVADVFDALLSKRPYKEPWSKESALDELRKGKGLHFEPLLVDLFCDVQPQVDEIIEEYSDENIKALKSQQSN
jgi:putative two-component system response regulator